jgi:hypothetical protein
MTFLPVEKRGKILKNTDNYTQKQKKDRYTEKQGEKKTKKRPGGTAGP